MARLIAAQEGRCCYCKRRFTPTGATIATFEHKKPRMYGGTFAVANLAAACKHCNQHRGMQMNATKQRRQQLAAAQSAVETIASKNPSHFFAPTVCTAVALSLGSVPT